MKLIPLVPLVPFSLHTHLLSMPSKPTITTADAPFNDPTDSVDLVIRTANNVEFFVLSGLLSLKSPSSFFRHVLQTNQHTEARNGFPVLEVKENSDIFLIILLLCYPYASPEIKSIRQLVEVGKALEKYCMDNASERFFQTVIASSLMREQALQVFAHAVSNGWKILGEAAARHTLATPLDTEVAFEDLKCINAFQYVVLRDYHRRCGIAAQAIMSASSAVTRMPWLKGKTSELIFLYRGKCQWCGRTTSRGCIVGDQPFSTHEWLPEYLAAMMVDLPGRPFPGIALGEDIIAQAAAKSISQCNHAEWAKIAGSQIHRFATLVAEEIDRLISQVRQ